MEKICPLQGRDAGEAVIKIPAETLLVNHGQHILALMLALYNIHGVLCTMHSVLCTGYCALFIIHCVLYTVYYALCTLHCVLGMMYYVLALKTLQVKPGQHPLEVPA